MDRARRLSLFSMVLVFWAFTLVIVPKAMASIGSGVILEYTLSVQDYSQGKMDVILEMDNVSSDGITLTEIDYLGHYKNIEHLKAYETNNNELNITLSGEHPGIFGTSAREWTINSAGANRIKVSYSVILNDIVSRDRQHHGYVGNGFALFEGGQVMLYPMRAQVNPDIQVRFNIPSGGSIVSTWPEKNGVYYPQMMLSGSEAVNPDRLLNNSVAIGNFESVNKQLSGTNFTVAYPTNWTQEQKQQVPSSMFEMLNYFNNLFSTSVGSSYLLVFSPEAADKASIWAGEGSFSQALSSSGRDYNYDMIAHQMFHRWNGFPPYGWGRQEEKLGALFREANTRYYESKSLFMVFDKLYGLNKNNLGLGKNYLAYKNKMEKGISLIPYTSASNTSANPEETWVAYDYGSLINFFLDMKIMEDSNGSNSFDDLMRTLNERHTNGKGIVTYSEILEILQSLTGKDYSSFFNQYVFGTTPLPLDEFFKDNDSDSQPNYLELIRKTGPNKADSFNSKLVTLFGFDNSLVLGGREECEKSYELFGVRNGRSQNTIDQATLDKYNWITLFDYPGAQTKSAAVSSLFAPLDTGSKNFLNIKSKDGKLLVYFNSESKDKLISLMDQVKSLSEEGYIDFDNPANNQLPSSSAQRMGGKDRYETSTLIAKSLAQEAVDTVILATGNDWADALLGSTLSKKYNAPILLVGQSPSESALALSFIQSSLKKDGRVIIMGQESAIPRSFEEAISGLGIKADHIERIAAPTRVSLSVATAKYLSPAKGSTLVIASELDYPDALSISSYASNHQSPIFLVPANQIPDEQLKLIQELVPNRIIIVGGTGVISLDIEKQLKGITSNVERYAGLNRYETSMKILKALYDQPTEICFAYGENYPDALSGSAYAASQSAPILVLPSSLDSMMMDALSYYEGASSTLFGGTGVISQITENTLVNLLK